MSERDKNQGGLREGIRFYLLDTRTLIGKLIDIFIISLNLLICGIYVIETYPLPQRVMEILWQVEVVVVFFFILEYAARVYGARRRLRYLFNIFSLIDLVTILPTVSLLVLPLFGLHPELGFIHTMRVFKVIRIFRFLRFTADPDFFFGSIPVSLLKVFRLFLTLLIIFFVSSGLFFHVESSVNRQVMNFGDAFYFTVVTLTTVGFGDIIPVSNAGRWVTVVMILSGIIFIPWQAGQVVREWVHISNKKDVICSHCGLKYHDRDASHCKACGHIIYQVYDSDI